MTSRRVAAAGHPEPGRRWLERACSGFGPAAAAAVVGLERQTVALLE